MKSIPLSEILQKKFIGTDDLRRELTIILEKLPKEKEIVITQHGKPQAVLLDLNVYLALQELEEEIADYDPKLVKRVNAALEDAEKGNVVDAETVFKELGLE